MVRVLSPTRNAPPSRVYNCLKILNLLVGLCGGRIDDREVRQSGGCAEQERAATQKLTHRMWHCCLLWLGFHFAHKLGSGRGAAGIWVTTVPMRCGGANSSESPDTDAKTYEDVIRLETLSVATSRPLTAKGPNMTEAPRRICSASHALSGSDL